VDKEKQHFLGFNTSLGTGVDVNRDFVPEAELNTQNQLADPRFRGKIVIQDVRGGSGQNRLASFLYAYGEQYVVDLLTKQEMVSSSDKRQMAEWVIRGRYPVAIGMGSDTLPFFHREGLGLNVKRVPGVETVAFDTVMTFDRSPNPSAAKVFVNWLLSQNTQERIAKTVTQNSLRADVPTVDPEGVLDRAKLGDYLILAREEYLPYRQRATQLATELFR
jgi:ABC-type Fe3+ transport system substrate-binding protein